jgi:hypothetical protein
MKTHEAQNAAYAEACNYLDELNFLQRLANTTKREQRQREQMASPASRTINILKAKFP